MKSGMSLSDTKILFRVAAVAARTGVMNERDAKDIEDIRQRIDRMLSLTNTHGDAKAKALLRFKPKMVPTREEEISQFLAQTTGNVPFGARWLIRPTRITAKTVPYKRAEPRPGSSASVIGRTKVTGARRVAKDLKALGDSIARLILNHSGDKKYAREAQSMLSKAAKSVETRTGRG